MDHHDLWQAALAKIELNLSRPNFLTWFHGTTILQIADATAMVCVPNSFVKEWLENKYHKSVLHALREISPEVRDITYVIGNPNAGRIPSFKDRVGRRNRPARAHEYAQDAGEEVAIKELAVNPNTSLNPRYTLNSFVVGSFNELAHAAALSIIKNPGTAYNPLFIYGGVGLGKTHLIQAIGNELLLVRPDAMVRYIPSERYMVEIVDALRNQEMNALKEKYRNVDLLIMDDIQFIARTEKMQEEFFHTFNALYEKNRQIIISSDRPPQAIATLESRLRSRFEGGMIADIGLPDLETRLTILKKKVENKEVVVGEDVLKFLALHIKTNIRELEGALNQIVIAAKLSSAPITEEAAKKVIASYNAAPKKFLSPKKILKAVADFYDIEEKDFMHRSRKKDVVRPRQIAMYLMREELKTSYPSIGEKFGGRDHTTVIHSCEKIGQDLLKNPEFAEEIKAIRDAMLLA